MRLYASTMLLLASSLAMAAANFSGKWALPAAGRGGSTILVLNQVGNEVFGTLRAAGNVGSGAPRNQEILDGKVEGDVITFYVWTGNDVPAKQMYKGTMSGDEITFEITGGAGRRGGTVQMARDAVVTEEARRLHRLHQSQDGLSDW